MLALVATTGGDNDNNTGENGKMVTIATITVNTELMVLIVTIMVKKR